MNRWNYLILLRPTRIGMITEGPTADEQQIVGEHFAYCKALVESDRMLLAGRTFGDAESTIGIAIISAENDEEAQSIAANDPAVKHGVMTSELQPYRVALLNSNPHNTN